MTCADRSTRGSGQFALLAANEIHRIGDALQGISEAILSASIGQSVHFDRYFSLRNVLATR